MKKTLIMIGMITLLMMSACAKNEGTDDTAYPDDRGTLQDSQQQEDYKDDDYDDGCEDGNTVYDIERVYTDGSFSRIIEGEEVPVIVMYGLGGESGYVSAVSQDPDTINEFIEAFRDLRIQSVFSEDEDPGYVADGGEDIVFGMEDGSQVAVALDGRTRIHTDGMVFHLENTGKLSEVCVNMQEMAYLNENGGQPGDGYVAVIHGGVGEKSYETYIYEKDKGYKYINVESTTVSWGAAQWNHEVTKIGLADTKEEVLGIAAKHGADSCVTFPGDNEAHPLSSF
ncbi:MAG: hypothetical protein IKR23_03470 [Lachnospiraceae bacterium]|nr:hypothetical protein [Lachnospiraceae bacterium]